MKTFDEKKAEAENVFFENYNFLHAKDFLYDFVNDEMIPCDKKSSSHDSFVSFVEFATVDDTADIFYLIEEIYDGTMESIFKLVKIFDDWFDNFYDYITNTECPKTLCGDYIYSEYAGMVQ